MPTFQDREEAIEQICAETGQNVILNIFGEAGIGKTRLLSEARQRLRARSPGVLVLYVDLDSIAHATASRPEGVLRALTTQAQDWLKGVWQEVAQVAGQVVAQLMELAERMRVVLMFDTTEAFQEDMEFWHWMEANLVGPLIIEGRVQQVFAGRVPAPWRRVEVRRNVELLPLGPLPRHDAAPDLIKEVLQAENPALENSEDLKRAINLVLEFSFGHPLLSEKLGAFIARRWPTTSLEEFKRKLCEQVVKPFVEESLFESVEAPWGEILWWASVLDWFDPTILRWYLERVAPALVKGRRDYFFIQGISRLRIHHTVVWREERGDRLHGIIGDIMRYCLRIAEPDRYHQACLAAAETTEALAAEFPPNDPEAQHYRQEAEVYRQRAEQEVEQ